MGGRPPVARVTAINRERNGRVRFGTFELDLAAGELRKSGLRIRIQGQPLEILALLLERPGEVVTREQLQQKLWPSETIVDFEHGLNKAINRLRDALADSSENPRFIETIPRHGYRFVTPIVPPLESARAEHPRERTVRWLRGQALLRSMAVFVLMLLSAALAYWLTHRPAALAPQLNERRLTTNSTENPVNVGAISPDGKYLAYSDQKGMHLKLIPTGEVTDIPQPESQTLNIGSWDPTGWFPDGTRFIAQHGEPGWTASSWVISVIGGPPHKLRDDAEVWSVSPDGTTIVYGVSPANHEIWLMGPQGEDPRKFVSGSENDTFLSAAWSPDSQRIAYAKLNSTAGKLVTSIETRDLKGGQPTVLASWTESHVASGTMVLWFPDGRLVYVVQELVGMTFSSNIWEVRADPKTGQALSVPKQVTHWAEIQSYISGTRDGRHLAVTKSTYHCHVEVVELEAGHGRFKNQRRLTLEEGLNNPVEWTPDSKTVIFMSLHNGVPDIYKQSLNQTVGQPVVTGPDWKDSPVVSPDGTWILYLSRANDFVATPVRVMRVPISGGPPQSVFEEQQHPIDKLACSSAPASLCVFGQRSPDNRQAAFSAFDPVRGRGKELLRVSLRHPPPLILPDLSPDGSRLALSTADDEGRTRIQIFPLAGGEAREINLRDWHGEAELRWAADGQGLLVRPVSESGGAGTILYVDLKGRAEEVWRQLPAAQPSFAPSPNGRYLAVEDDSFDSNVWLLENF